MKELHYAILLFLCITIIAAGCGGKEEPLYQELPLKTWVKRLSNSEPEVRADALKVIAEIGKPARPAEERVRRVARYDESIEVRLLAIDALKAMDAPTHEFIEFLEECNKPIIPIEEETVEFKSEMSTEDEMSAKMAEEDDLEYIRALIEGNADSSAGSETSIMPEDSAKLEEWVREKVSNEAQNMMNKLSNPNMLAELLSSGDELEREYAARKLAELSGDNPNVIAALEKALKDSNEEVRRAVEQALKNWQE